MPDHDDGAQALELDASLQTEQGKKKPAAKDAASKKTAAGKPPAKRGRPKALEIPPGRAFDFPGLKEALEIAQKALTETEQALVRLETGVTRAMGTLHKAEENLVVRRMAAREKGTVGAKSALAKAREAKHKAAAELQATKAEYRSARAAFDDASAAIKRLFRAEQRLLKMAAQVEAKLARKIIAEEKKILSTVFAPPKKRRTRRKKAADAQQEAPAQSAEPAAE